MHEIIEFPSVLLRWNTDINNYEKISEFQEYCKPLQNTKLSKFCTELTGITQEQVDNGGNFVDVLKRHQLWITSHIQKDDILIFLTFGYWDLATVMIQECKRWAVTPNNIYTQFINVKEDYKSRYKCRGGMDKVLKHAHLELLGRHHSGIDDCRNIARIFQYMIDDGCNMNNFVVNRVDKKKYNEKFDIKSEQFYKRLRSERYKIKIEK
jgi:inhibitor of KinA sporulation pathway (predicted exonuclease)